jgi:hypothetical protein
MLSGCATVFACNAYSTYSFPGMPIPSYYVLGDPLFQSDDYIDNLESFFCSIVRRFPGVTLATSQSISKHIYRKILGHPDILCKILYAPFGPHPLSGKYMFNLQHNIEPYQNVLVLMIQYAVFLGFRKIELFGFDLSMSHSYQQKASDYFAEQTLTYSWIYKPAAPSDHVINQKKALLRNQIQAVIDSARELNVEILWM